ncbi:unnamed protein product [Symbiodinium sp. KB8]|nr:unnamed protein product [Symbiodinium sp. KB8]
MGNGFNRPCCDEGVKAPATEVVAASTPIEICDGSMSPQDSSEYPQMGRLGTSSSFNVQRQPAPGRMSRLMKLKHLEIDEDIMRGADLRRTLWHCGRAWRRPPSELSENERAQLWKYSTPVDGFDTFVSHTWLTPGKWKVFSLMVQKGWQLMLASWAMAVVVIMVLCMTDVLPMPWTYQARFHEFEEVCPLGPWILLVGILALILGLVISPYLPTYQETMFFDMFSIHQTDARLMERGVYGLGGCLRRSRQLQVLWSSPYLSRLWCVFELAAYRQANPNGKICWTPLFRERALLAMFVICCWMTSLFWAFAALQAGPESFMIGYAASLLPVILGTHVLRRTFREGQKMLDDLQYFDLASAGCALEFDRRFIYTAIQDWYESEEAFTQYVRGPLREELLTSASFQDIPLHHYMILLPVGMSLSLEFLVALLKGGAPAPVLASNVIGLMLGFDVAWAVFCLDVFHCMCFRFASPKFACLKYRKLLDFGQSILIVLLSVLCWAFGGEVSQLAVHSGVWPTLGWTAFAICCALASLKGVPAAAAFSGRIPCVLAKPTDAQEVVSI